MCYYLYGGINKEANISDLNAIDEKSFNLKNDTKDNIKKAIIESDWSFRLTDNYCDCETGIGSKKTTVKDLIQFNEYIQKLKTVRQIKFIYVSKKWSDDDINEVEIEVHIDDIDSLKFFANIEEDTFYKINFFKRY